MNSHIYIYFYAIYLTNYYNFFPLVLRTSKGFKSVGTYANPILSIGSY
jgi:hypothetical protein